MSVEIFQKFITDIIEAEVSTRWQLDKSKRQFCRENKIVMPQNDQLLAVYHNLIKNNNLKRCVTLENILTLKNTRSLSGIVVISVLTKPYGCPGKCLYCPTEKNVPKSYFSNEPAVMRAITCKYDPYLQAASRLKALDAVGHITDKINIRIIGGTWSYYPKAYQTWFVKRIFQACNEYSSVIPAPNQVRGKSPAGIQSMNQMGTPQSDNSQTLDQVQMTNEAAKHRIVEISVETRQDFVNRKEIIRLRKLGVTKVELGVQTLYDEVLLFNKRGNTNQATIDATKLLKDAGFKISYQMMLNLPGSDLEKDLEMFKTIFSDPDYQPDHMKIYPMALVKESGAYRLYQTGKYRPYTKDELVTLISLIKGTVPYYCRIERVIRDIPATSIVEGGAMCSNLRQEVTVVMNKNGEKCKCIRCREVKGNFNTKLKWKIFRQDYDSAGGKDIFLSIESTDRKYLFSLLRLRTPSQYFSNRKHDLKVLDGSALIREIHTYGPQVEVGKRNDFASQHQGFGKLLVAEAEMIATNEYDLKKMAIISGVGVRQFFASQGYSLADTYMVKELT